MRIVGLFILFVIVGCQQDAGQRSVDIASHMDEVSYSIGVDVGKSFNQQNLGLSPELVAQGIEDAMKDSPTRMEEKEMEACLKQFNEDMMAKQNTDQKGIGEENTLEGEKFLAENKTKEGVITTASGLQYKVIESGKGRTPKLSDTVETHYRGTLINGKEFDSSYKRGETISFPVSGVIKGWTEALQLMQEGDKWQLYIPSDLAYGPRGAGGDIGPNATLIFDIELVSVK